MIILRGTVTCVIELLAGLLLGILQLLSALSDDVADDDDAVDAVDASDDVDASLWSLLLISDA